jgi:hypothetical protein
VSGNQPGIKARALTEAKTLFFLLIYLFLLLSAFTTYRRLILAQYEVGYVFHYGANMIEAILLAKVISVGRFLRLGERFRSRALIIPTIYKTVCFSLFAVVFFIVEETVIGWLRGKPMNLVLAEIFSQTVWGILAKVLVLFMALAPLFAIWETGHMVGEHKLFEWFFKPHAADTDQRRRQFGT